MELRLFPTAQNKQYWFDFFPVLHKHLGSEIDNRICLRLSIRHHKRFFQVFSTVFLIFKIPRSSTFIPKWPWRANLITRSNFLDVQWFFFFPNMFGNFSIPYFSMCFPPYFAEITPHHRRNMVFPYFSPVLPRIRFGLLGQWWTQPMAKLHCSSKKQGPMWFLHLLFPNTSRCLRPHTKTFRLDGWNRDVAISSLMWKAGPNISERPKAEKLCFAKAEFPGLGFLFFVLEEANQLL